MGELDTMKSACFLLALALVASQSSATSSSSYASTAASTATSSFASASTYASGSTASPTGSATPATPTPAPTPPTPAGAATKVIHTVRSTITLAGVPKSAFDATTTAGQKVRLAFKKAVAKGLKICGPNGNMQCSSTDIVIVSVSRRRRSGATVDFYVKTSSAANAQAGATSLNTMLTANGGGDFITSLKSTAKASGATELEQATGLKVVVAPVAGTSTVPTPAVAGAATAAVPITSLASLVSATLMMLQ